MKKYLRIIIALSCCIYLCGCGAVEGNVKVEGNSNASDNLYNVENDDSQDATADVENLGSEVVGETDNNTQSEEMATDETNAEESEPEAPVEERVFLLTKMKKKAYDSEGLQKEEYYEYDKFGNEIIYRATTYSYYDFGDYWWRTNKKSDYTYDENGRVLKYVLEQTDMDTYSEENQTKGEIGIFEYDEFGTKISASYKEYVPYSKEWIDGFSIKYAIDYNDKGQVIKQSRLEGDGSVLEWIEREYNEDGLLVKEKEYDYGKMKAWVEWEYNEEGVLVKRTNYDAENNVTLYSIYNNEGKLVEDRSDGIFDTYILVNKEYDEAGNCIKEIEIEIDEETNEKTFVSKYIREYDSKGNMVLEKLYVYDENVIKNWYEYEYDEAGNAIKITTYDGEDNDVILVGEYQYDENGNMIKEETRNAQGDIRSSNEYKYIEIVK